ncbi:hypothetical protein F5Y11DRAFT_38482 [Daldinia sp. FL1419]|nr:hypothetical protein F5Y11DRAFT_38482 [Daldinia sp. FL1419]
MNYHKCFKSARESIVNWIASLELSTIDWAHEIQHILWACILATIIVKFIMIVSDKLGRYPTYNSAVNNFTSYFYHPRTSRKAVQATQIEKPPSTPSALV